MVWGINKILEIAKRQPQAAYAALPLDVNTDFLDLYE